MSFARFAAPPAMHIPDGFLSLPIALAFWLISASILFLALRRTRNELGERQVPLMGVMAAFIFAAQMFNFPVAGGTSGHLLGGTLAAIALGPWQAILVMASVIIFQGLLFQDGGLLVMGANLFNMGFLTVAVSYGIYRLFLNSPRGLRLAAAGLAAWLSVMTAALAASIELWLSGTALLTVVIPAMLGVHALIGIGEALISVGALAFILRTRPDLIEHQGETARGGRGWVAVGVVIVLAMLLLSPLASINPDGLNRVAMNLGFISRASSGSGGLLPQYALPALGAGGLSRIISGVIGALVVAAAVLGLTFLLNRKAK